MTDRDVRLARALDRLTPALPEYHHDWQDVLGRAQSRGHGLSRPSRRVAIGVAVAVVAAAVGVALGVTTPWESGSRFLEAKVLGRAEAALALPSGTVLHMKLEDSYKDLGRPTTITTELWLNHHGEFRGFVHEPIVGRVEIGGTQDLRRSVEYDPRANAIGPGLVGGTFYAFGDDVRVLRRELARGAATADGETTIDGRDVVRIRLKRVGADCKPVVDYLYVDPKTYYPVEYRVIDFASRSGTKPHTTYYRIPAVRRFQTFERLPATPANLRLTSIEEMHPSAKVYPPVSTRPALPPCASPR